MTPPKTLSPAEALRALADGKKLSCSGWGASQYVYLNRHGELIDEQKKLWKADEFNDLYEYTEPKPKRKVAPYYVERINGVKLETHCFETDSQARAYYNEAISVTRCTALEIEV